MAIFAYRAVDADGRISAGNLDAATLRDAMTWATTTPRDAFHTRHDWDWDTIADQTVRAYETVTAARRATSLLRRWAIR